MGIAIACHCGKKMVAREQFAGRQVKCPQCGAVVQIPNIELKNLSDPPGEISPRPRPSDEQRREQMKTPVSLPEIIPFKAEADRARAQMHAESAKPQAARAATASSAVATAPNPWEDRSLKQVTTPWLPGDQERFQAGVRTPTEGIGVGGLLIAV